MTRARRSARAGRTLLVVLSLLVLPGASRAQVPAARPAELLRVFVDCGSCDFDHLRVETPWVEFVRERTAADVHLLVTPEGTGAGGQRYTIHAIGLAAFRGRADTLAVATEPGVTTDAQRTELARGIHLALLPFAARTPSGRMLRVAARPRDVAPPRPASSDRWNAWVFRVGADAGVEREQQQSDLDWSAELTARRITPALKTGIELEADFSRSRFTLDEEEGGRRVTSTFEEYEAGAVMVYSLRGQWGAGAEVALSSSTFDNTRFALRIAPAIEYSVWPYEEATRRQLTIQYSAGASSFRYREETIFDRFQETRPTHALVIGYDARQPWGSASATVEGSSYLDDATQNRLVADAEIHLRITRGLELSFGGNAALIHDQLAIVKRDATPEEILLQRRALRTDYRYDLSVGLSYTFGALSNSVVNPRFGTGPGDILR